MIERALNFGELILGQLHSQLNSETPNPARALFLQGKSKLVRVKLTGRSAAPESLFPTVEHPSGVCL